MLLRRKGEPLEPADLPDLIAGPGEVVLKVEACGVCRTDLHVLDGELDRPRLPLVPGHEIAGRILSVGGEVSGLAPGDRVGVPWLGWTCGDCRFCASGRENLCIRARFTGYTLDGGYAEQARASARFVFPLPAGMDAPHAAPLLCAGLIGHRSLRMTGDAKRIGLFGFGAAAHIVAQEARWQGRRLFAFTRPGDATAQAFARSLGAEWAGGSDEKPPETLDAAIVFAPTGALIPAALGALDRGGVVVCGGVHMSDIPSFPYHLLWQERSIRSVANLTRKDGEEFFALVAQFALSTEVHPYPLAEANHALDDLRHGRFSGAAVLIP